MSLNSTSSYKKKISYAAIASISTLTLLGTAACATNNGDSTASSSSSASASSSSSSDSAKKSGSSSSKQSSGDAASADIGDRVATGDLSAPGGARRLTEDQQKELQKAISESKAKNVILLIGDGMGDSEITLARDYAEGAGGSFKGIDALPVTGQYTHYSLTKDGKPNYVTDSAASATAWTTGTKSYNGAIGVDIKGKDLPTMLEIAKANGKATGNVSTAAIQDATPAAQVAHVTHRKCYGPDTTSEKCSDNALENGGKGSISEQMINFRPDITLGGGLESFEEKAKAGDYKGKTILEQAKERGYNIVKNAKELDDVPEVSQDAPVLGLFADEHMPVRWEGPKATYQGYLEPAAECKNNPERGAGIPSLADMTSKAIRLLKDKEEGFVLQVEGASIDKQDHDANPCGQIGETVDLDEAVQEALKFAKEDGETLVVVTADHAHTSQIVANKSEEDIKEAAEEAEVSEEEARKAIYPGLTRKLKTKEGGELTVNYATSGNTDIESEGHTGTQLRLAAFGPGAANVAGLTDQTDLFFTITDALELDTKKTESKETTTPAPSKSSTQNPVESSSATKSTESSSESSPKSTSESTTAESTTADSESASESAKADSKESELLPVG